jgi:hypothetical protein
MTSSTWAAGAAEDSADTLATFQEKLPVHLIATSRSAFKTCSPDEELSMVVARPKCRGTYIYLLRNKQNR